MTKDKIDDGDGGIFFAMSVGSKVKHCFTNIEYEIIEEKKTFEGFEDTREFWIVNSFLIF